MNHRFSQKILASAALQVFLAGFLYGTEPHTGLVMAKFPQTNRSDVVGSGAIARDPRLVYSCGHSFYENGVWKTGIRFFRAYHSTSQPNPADGAPVWGSLHYSTYGKLVKAHTKESYEAYDADFSIIYGRKFHDSALDSPSNLIISEGGSYDEIGDDILTSPLVAKQIVGYPAYRSWRQTSTRILSERGTKLKSSMNLIRISEFRATPGFSGGPVIYYPPVPEGPGGPGPELVGITVAGGVETKQTLIYRVGDVAEKYADTALGLAANRKLQHVISFEGQTDRKSSGQEQEFSISEFDGKITGMKCELDSSAPHSGDMKVRIISPEGRVKAFRLSESVDAVDLSPSFEGLPANGRWRLMVANPQTESACPQGSVRITLTGNDSNP